MVNKEDLLIFKMREKKQGQNVQPPSASAPTPLAAQVAQETEMQPEEPLPEEMEAQVPNALKQPVSAEQPVASKQKPAKKQRGKAKEDYKAESKRQAKGMYCEWHPWRPAYALCYTCHKSYCYEDIQEYNDKYYCLEDIDAATASEKPTVTFGYNKASMISASAFILTMLVYVYFVNSLLIYTVTRALDTGIPAFIEGNFIKNINLGYTFLFAGLIILIFVFIAGLLIFAQSKKGYWLAIFSGSIATIFFSYVYVNNFQIYGVIISALSILGIIGLRYAIHSKTTEETTPAPTGPTEPLSYNFPSAGRF
jgi:preprotein translocase subunit SecG